MAYIFGLYVALTTPTLENIPCVGRSFSERRQSSFQEFFDAVDAGEIAVEEAPVFKEFRNGYNIFSIEKEVL
jgi:hypothetical protein